MTASRDRPATGLRRRRGGTAVPLGLAAGLAVGLWAAHRAGAGSRALTPADEQLAELLSGIDYVPSHTSFDELLGPQAAGALIAVARGENPSLTDAGARTRAYRALADYPSSETSEVLRTAVIEHGAVATGVDTVYVRAAMRSLAETAHEGAVSTIASMLDHPSRDVRVAAAHALGQTRAESAIAPLRARRADEPILQVQLAIDDALRLLGEPKEETNPPP